MTDDARHMLTEEERARIHAARRDGRTCALCGRFFVEGETIWMERLAIRHERGATTDWRAPVGVECVSPETIRATCNVEPVRCAGCGRSIRYGVTSSRRRLSLCSRRCAVRHQSGRAKEARQ